MGTLVTRSATGTATSNYFYNNQGLRVAKWSQELQADPPPPPPPPPPGDDGPPVRPPPPGDCLYDKAGNIISCSVTSGAALQGVATLYVHDQQGQLLGEYNGQTGAALREYIWLQGMPVAMLAYELGTAANPAPVFFIQTDHLDTPRVVLDRNGAQRWSWVALPFGGGSPVTNPVGLGEFELNLRMPGQYFDKESGLSQNWHRDYDAGVGRFTQSDPIGLAGGINTYAYVDSNPLSFVDPDGLDKIPKNFGKDKPMTPLPTSKQMKEMAERRQEPGQNFADYLK